MSDSRALTLKERKALTAAASQTGISALALVLYHGLEPVREAVRLLKMSDNTRKEILDICKVLEPIVNDKSLSDLGLATVNEIRDRFGKKSPAARDYALEFYERPNYEREEIDKTIAEVVAGIINKAYTPPQLEAAVSLLSRENYDNGAQP